MLIKIFNRGKSRGEGPINYLLGEKFLDGGPIRDGAKVLSGDAFIVQEMINSSNFSKRYTAGVLSFAEGSDQISEETKQQIMRNFEKAMFPGMNPDRYNILWVEHTDKPHPDTGKPRLELNFLIATTELYTGQRLQPYYHVLDAKYFRSWQTLTNDRFGLTDPDDPTHARLTNQFDSNQSPKKTFENIKDDIAEYLKIQMSCGLIENRDDVIWQIENIPNQNFKLSRVSKKFISITDGNNKKPIRLEGFLFEEDFTYDKYQNRIQTVDDAAEKTVQKIETAASKQKRLEQAREDFIGIYEHKKNLNIQKYHIPEDEVEWVSKYFAPIVIEENQTKVVEKEQIKAIENENTTSTALDEFDEQVEQIATTINENDSPVLEDSSVLNQEEEIKRTSPLSDESENLSLFDPSIEQIKQAQAKKKAKEEAEEKARRLQAEFQLRVQQQQDIERRKQKEEDHLRAIRRQMIGPINNSSATSADAYDNGYKKLIELIKNNFTPALNQHQSGYLNTLRLSIGRFENKLHVTKDGRIGIDYSPYSNVTDFKFFYASDLFELKNDKLYIKDSGVYYELSQFSDREKTLVEESLTNSLKNKQDRFARPQGLQDAFITYSSDLKTLPTYGLKNNPLTISDLDNISINRHSNNADDSDIEPDDNDGPSI